MAELDPLVERANARVHEAETLLSIARDSGLQSTEVESLDAELRRLARDKRNALKAGDEDRTNLILGFQCVLSCLQSELKMWLLLKQEAAEKAWDCLIDAKEAAAAATRAHRGFGHVEHHLARLEAIEELVFPPQVFVSSGFLVGRQRCSICRSDYEACAHVAGRPYWGLFCTVIQQDVTLDHVAIVDHPADKRCRVANFDVEGGRRNRMTWKVTPSVEGVIDDMRIATAREDGGPTASCLSGSGSWVPMGVLPAPMSFVGQRRTSAPLP